MKHRRLQGCYAIFSHFMPGFLIKTGKSRQQIITNKHITEQHVDLGFEPNHQVGANHADSFQRIPVQKKKKKRPMWPLPNQLKQYLSCTRIT